MKLKQQPEDFQVEELAECALDPAGEFALYRLEKTGWTTADALAALRRRWQVDLRRVSYGGLKDRHAMTSQYVSIYRGPRRNLTHERIAVTYLGQRREPFTAAGIIANRFNIQLRSLSVEDVARALQALTEVAQVGLPNYFDDQRFGSVGNPPEFVAKEMVRGQFERALWLALAASYEHDRAEARREKTLLRTHWGEWPLLKDKLPRGHARSLVDYLVHHPQDHKGAVARLRPDLQGLYLSAYQSYLWNRMLGEWLVRNLAREELGTITLRLGMAPVPMRIGDSRLSPWASLQLPLPSARLKPEPGADWLPVLEAVLDAEGLRLADVKIKGMQKPFFSRGERAAFVYPSQMMAESGADELNKGKQKLRLKFELPRGSYATILVKRITACVATPEPANRP